MPKNNVVGELDQPILDIELKTWRLRETGEIPTQGKEVELRTAEALDFIYHSVNNSSPSSVTLPRFRQSR